MDNLPQIVGLIIGFVVHFFATVKYLLDRMDAKMEAERKERTASEVKLREDLKDFVLKEDYHRSADDIKVQIAAMSSSFNSRLDQLFALMSQVMLKSGVSNDK